MFHYRPVLPKDSTWEVFDEGEKQGKCCLKDSVVHMRLTYSVPCGTVSVGGGLAFCCALGGEGFGEYARRMNEIRQRCVGGPLPAVGHVTTAVVEARGGSA